MRREQYYFRNAKFIFIFIFCLFNVRSHGQTSCCLTNTLNISTGYDPLTASLLTPGCDGCIAVSDPGWKVSYISPDLMSVMIASGFTPGSPQADVIQNYPPYWCTSTTSDWISCFNGRGLSPIFSSGTFEYQLSRTFTLACAACVNFNLTIAADNYISDISVGSTHLYGPQDPAANNWTTAVTPSISCVNLGPGTYTIVVTAILWA
jgi:hypothetical protein